MLDSVNEALFNWNWYKNNHIHYLDALFVLIIIRALIEFPNSEVKVLYVELTDFVNTIEIDHLAKSPVLFLLSCQCGASLWLF